MYCFISLRYLFLIKPIKGYIKFLMRDYRHYKASIKESAYGKTAQIIWANLQIFFGRNEISGNIGYVYMQCKTLFSVYTFNAI